MKKATLRGMNGDELHASKLIVLSSLEKDAPENCGVFVAYRDEKDYSDKAKAMAVNVISAMNVLDFNNNILIEEIPGLIPPIRKLVYQLLQEAGTLGEHMGMIGPVVATVAANKISVLKMQIEKLKEKNKMLEAIAKRRKKQ